MRTLLWPGILLLAACGSVRVVDRADGGEPILIRGGQPTAMTLRRLQDLYGVRTVVNLRGEHPGVSWFEEERRGVESINARWVHLAMSGIESPESGKIDAFFDVVQDPANWPVYLHCASGIHRTGLVSALYRMQYNGWTAEEALAEMDRRGFHWGAVDRSAVRRYVTAFRPDPRRRLGAVASR